MGAGSDDERMHELLGAFVLGGLGDDDRHAFTAHLRSCAVCQREAAQLSGIPGLLDLVDPAVLSPDGVAASADGTPSQPTLVPDLDPVPGRLLSRVRADRRRRRWRLAAAAAVVALLAGGIGASIGPVTTRLTAPPTTRFVATAAPASGAQVEIDLVTRGWGTQLDVRGSGLPTTGVLLLSVTNAQGYTYDVASWSGTPSGRTTLTAPCWMKPADIKALQVHTRDGATLATVTTATT